MKIRLFGLLLAVLGVFALLPGLTVGSASAALTYGVSRVDGVPGIAIHWVLCNGVAPRSVDLEGYWGGSELPTAVPVFWQVRSDAAPAADVQIATYVVGQTPAGFYETVPLRRALPADLIVISAPPGDASASDGMSFHVGELRQDAIYRGDYQFVSAGQFAAEGTAYCRARSRSSVPALGLVGLGLAGLLLVGRRRPLLVILAALGVAGGLLALLAPRISLPSVIPARQSPSAFSSGATKVPAGSQVLADVSPATTRSQGGMYVARFVAPGPYAFAVTCGGSSLQIGEASDIENGSTGGRQLVGCATGAPVNGTIANRLFRGEVVEVVVNPNGMTDWRVVVIPGLGQVGPFDEP